MKRLALLVVACLLPALVMAQGAVGRAEALLTQGNLPGALELARGPAEAGDARAQFIVGMVMADGKRLAEARQWWQRSLAGGQADAATALGYFAMDGRGGEPRSSARAAQYFEQGARMGSAQGMLNLARLLVIGDGVALDRKRAAELRRRAATSGEPTAKALVRAGGNLDAPAVLDAATWLGNFNRARDAIALLTREADAGNVSAMVTLGKAYYNGQAGGGRDYARARQWWEKAGNHPGALYYLGVLYMYGRGVHSDWARAETYFDAAARHGHPDGQRMAATMRDLKVPPLHFEEQLAANEMRCGVYGGTALGMGCWKDSQPLW